MDEFERLLNALDDIPAEIAEAVGGALRKQSLNIVRDAKSLIRPHSDTGRLMDSITSRVGHEGGDIVATVGTNVSYAAYVEMGTGPKGAESPKDLPPGITPKYRTTAWGYRDPKTGEKIWTRGRAATPFLYPAFRRNKDAVKQAVAAAIRRCMGGG